MQIQKENRSEQIIIQACHTYMIKEDDDTSTDEVKISLISGEAQIFGMEIKKYYPLKYEMPCIILIFTWVGCQIKVEWPEQKGGKSKQNWCDLTSYNDIQQSPMLKYLTLHYQLTLIRRLAHQQMQKGPRLAIIGGQKSGTHEASKLMLNYAGKLNMRPIFVDLDLQNSIYLDGSMGVAAYQYRVTTEDNLFQKCQKMCYIYGNRKIRKMPYLRIAQQLAKFTNQKMQHEMENIKWKGTNLQTALFASGIIMNLPKVSQEQYLIEIIAQVLFNFNITHVVIIQNPIISNFVARNCPNIKIINTAKLQGIDILAKIKNKNKLTRFFGAQLGQALKVKISQIFLYELIQEEHKNAYVRRIDIKTQHINKTAVSIIKCRRQTLDAEEIARKISQNTVYSACRISKIEQQYVTFETPFVDNFYEQTKDLIWVSMISEK